MKKVYIAGKIFGDKDYKGKFHAAKTMLEQEKYIALNPAELPEGMEPADYMKICFSMIDVADVVLFLSGWQYSKGAMLEKTYCDYVGKSYWLDWDGEDLDDLKLMVNWRIGV